MPTPHVTETGLRAALGRALACGDPVVERLSDARSIVSFVIVGEEDPVTLHLDERPARLGDGEALADIELELTPEQARRFATGLLPMPAAVATKAVACDGPVRKYLQVDPILRRLLAGNRLSGEQSRRHQPTAAPAEIGSDIAAIETRDLHKAFGARPVLAGASLRIPEGVVAGILGPAGAGKTVLLQHIIGLVRPDCGDVIVRGRRLGTMSEAELLALSRDVGVMCQDDALFSTLDVFDNVAFPLRRHTDLPESTIEELVMARLAEVGLSDAARRFDDQLSDAMRKRARLARALVLDPGIVLCDEPDSGLDPVRAALMGELLVETASRMGGTMVVTSRNAALIEQISEHVSILDRGRIVESCLRTSTP